MEVIPSTVRAASSSYGASFRLERTATGFAGCTGSRWRRMGAEFILDTPVVRSFVADVQSAIAAASSPEEACEAIRPRFAELLADPDWFFGEYQAAAPESGMGGSIGSGFCTAPATARSRSSRSWCRPAPRRRITTTSPGGSSASTAARRTRRSTPGGNGAFELVERRALGRGDFYVLIPPRDDIHRVRRRPLRHPSRSTC